MNAAGFHTARQGVLQGPQVPGRKSNAHPAVRTQIPGYGDHLDGDARLLEQLFRQKRMVDGLKQGHAI